MRLSARLQVTGRNRQLIYVPEAAAGTMSDSHYRLLQSQLHHDRVVASTSASSANDESGGGSSSSGGAIATNSSWFSNLYALLIVA